MKFIKINDHIFDGTNQYILDTNIRILLYGNNQNQTEEEKQLSHLYSNFFKKILDSKSKIYLPYVILSEYRNKYINYEFNYWKSRNQNKNFKNFRESKEFTYNITYYKRDLETLINICDKINDQFEIINDSHIFSNLKHLDLNDIIIHSISSYNNLFLVTHDRDYLSLNETSNITILSANEKYFKYII